MGEVEGLIARINKTICNKHIAKVTFGEQLNRYLPKELRYKMTKSKTLAVYRWLRGQSKPRAEIIIAMQKWLDANE